MIQTWFPTFAWDSTVHRRAVFKCFPFMWKEGFIATIWEVSSDSALWELDAPTRPPPRLRALGTAGLLGICAHLTLQTRSPRTRGWFRKLCQSFTPFPETPPFVLFPSFSFFIRWEQFKRLTSQWWMTQAKQPKILFGRGDKLKNQIYLSRICPYT